jgi:hypothetical protein
MKLLATLVVFLVFVAVGHATDSPTSSAPQITLDDLLGSETYAPQPVSTCYRLFIVGSGCGARVATPTPSCVGKYPAGTFVSITAQPLPGNILFGWIGCDNAASATGNPCEVTMNSDRTVRAVCGAP